MQFSASAFTEAVLSWPSVFRWTARVPWGDRLVRQARVAQHQVGRSLPARLRIGPPCATLNRRLFRSVQHETASLALAGRTADGVYVATLPVTKTAA
ncbi:hypothetical protein BURKHO8Y_450005 [Burkholderia sp. 8Y]|nr:hypothetical protein BURKHO8Y_450005 [Burkholderia sp. 8Y]